MILRGEGLAEPGNVEVVPAGPGPDVDTEADGATPSGTKAKGREQQGELGGEGGRV